MTLIAFTGLLGCLWFLVVVAMVWFFWSEPIPAKPRETYNQGVSMVLNVALGITGSFLAVFSVINWWRG